MNDDRSMPWHHLRAVRRSITAIKAAAFLVLVEQGLEAALLGVSLAEHPALVIAAIGALGFPIPTKEPRQP